MTDVPKIRLFPQITGSERSIRYESVTFRVAQRRCQYCSRQSSDSSLNSNYPLLINKNRSSSEPNTPKHQNNNENRTVVFKVNLDSVNGSRSLGKLLCSGPSTSPSKFDLLIKWPNVCVQKKPSRNIKQKKKNRQWSSYSLHLDIKGSNFKSRDCVPFK